MNRAELITLLQIERGLKIAACHIVDSITVTREDHARQEMHGRRVFQPDANDPKLHHYKVPPTLNVDEGDLVVLPVKDTELVFGRIHKIHAGIPDGLDLSSMRYNLRWIIGTVDMRLHDTMMAEEHQIGKQLQRAEVNQKLADFQKSAGIDLGLIALPSFGKESEVVDGDPD